MGNIGSSKAFRTRSSRSTGCSKSSGSELSVRYHAGTDNKGYLEPLALQLSAHLGARQTIVEPMTHRNDITNLCSTARLDSSTESSSTGKIQPEPYRSFLPESEARHLRLNAPTVSQGHVVMHR